MITYTCDICGAEMYDRHKVKEIIFQDLNVTQRQYFHSCEDCNSKLRKVVFDSRRENGLE